MYTNNNDVIIQVNPPLTADDLFAFYERNDICEIGFGKETAAKILRHPHLIVAAYAGGALVGLARATFDGLSAHVMEFSLDLRFQGGDPKYANGSLIEADNGGLGRRLDVKGETIMRRIGIVMTLGLALLVSAYGQTPQSSGRTTQSQGQAAKPKQTAKFKGKILRERLPKGVEGVVLDKGTGSLKLKSGYEFVRKNASTVPVVRRMAGGGRGGIVFEGSCDCRAETPDLEAPGACSVTIMDPFLYCQQGSCAGKCSLTVTVGGKKLGVIMC